MFLVKLLANYSSCLHCTSYFEHAEHSLTFHILHITCFIILELIMFERVILNYVMLISNKPIKVADLQKLANQLMLNGALAIDLSVKARKTLVIW